MRARLTAASLLPRTISHALIDNVSLNCLHLLPHQFAAVFGQPFAIRLRRRNVGVRVIFIRADCDGTQGAERGKCPPTAAMTYAVSAAPCRVIMAANDSAAGAARWHPAQARRGDGSRAAWRDNAWSGGGRYHLATGGSRGDHFPRGLRLRDCTRRSLRLPDCARSSLRLPDCARSSLRLPDCARSGRWLSDYARRGLRLSNRARCRPLWRRHTWSCSLRSRPLGGRSLRRAERAAGAAFLEPPLLPCCCCAEKSVLVADRSCAALGVQGANIMVAASRPALIRLIRVKSILLAMTSPFIPTRTLADRGYGRIVERF